MTPISAGYCCYFDVITGLTSYLAGPLGFDLAVSFFVEFERRANLATTSARRIVAFDGSRGEHFLIVRDRETRAIHFLESGVLTRPTAHWWWCRTSATLRSTPRTYAMATNDVVAWLRERVAGQPDVDRAQLIEELALGWHVGKSELDDVIKRPGRCIVSDHHRKPRGLDWEAKPENAWYAPLRARIDEALKRGDPFWFGLPDAWYARGKYRCANGHVSTRILKSEARGDCCLACGSIVRMTFPEDEESPEPG